MEKDIKHYKLGYTIEEFEDLFGNTPIDDIEKIKKYLYHNFIPKSKVKEILDKKFVVFYEGDAEFPDDATKIYGVKYIKTEHIEELMEDK